MAAHGPNDTLFARTLFYHPDSNSAFYGRVEPGILEQGCVEVSPLELPAGTRIITGRAYSTILPDMDFETYSAAGYYWVEPHTVWDQKKGKYVEKLGKWKPINDSAPYGLPAVGAQVYVEHESFDILSLTYDLKDGRGPRLWVPGVPYPEDLFHHLRNGGLIEAWNSGFEWHVWQYYCAPVLGWPPLDYRQTRDAMAKARAWSLPGKLAKAGEALEAPIQKDKDGDRLLKKFSKPRNPTKKDPRTRIRPEEDLEDGPKLYKYNQRDIEAEASISSYCPDLTPSELDLWLVDQRINFRGVYIDKPALEACKAVVEQAFDRYNDELRDLTGGAVEKASQLERLKGWLAGHGVYVDSLDEEGVKLALSWDLPPEARRAIEIRASIGSASVKKVFAIDRRLPSDNRLKELFAFCGADRTGRWAGRGPQPQNLPNSGPKVKRCDPINGCGRHSGIHVDTCPWCGAPAFAQKGVDWGPDAVDDALEVIATKSLDYVEMMFGDATAAVAGCLRGLFCASPGHDLICSDFSAIEAVVLAALAGEEWRLDVFRDHGKIYEMSASKITGIPFEEFVRHKKETGEHHPMRKKVGKVAELASGYQGSVGAWLAFGAGDFMDEDEILKNVRAWREASPAIVDLWYGLERAAVAAVQNPGQCFQYRGIVYGVKDDVLYCRLLSGRMLSYHQPRLRHEADKWGKMRLKLSFMGWNSDYTRGPVGWMRIDTYGGKLTENITQAHARDIQANSLVAEERAGYSVVLHVHDEIVSEVREGTGDVADFERIMATMPAWAADWPIRAAGGWRRKRYGKD